MADLSIEAVITGNCGPNAFNILEAAEAKVVTDAPTESPEVLVKQYLEQTMVTGENVCGHDPKSPCNH